MRQLQIKTRTQVAVTLLAATWSGLALAQSATAPADAGEQLQTVVVTAQRRKQPIQDVPESVAAITGPQIRREELKSLADYLTAVPGITYDQSQGPAGAYGRQTIGIRGVQRFAYATDNTVGFYLDDTPIDITNLALFDLNRIEVLRGPQGTLYGSGSEGGTIKLITNQPTLGLFSGKASLEGTSVNHGAGGGEADLALNIPLGRTVALRVDGSYQRIPGYIDNYDNSSARIASNINANTSEGFRAQLLIEPIPGLKITPAFYYNRLESSAAPNFEVGSGLPSLSMRQYAPTDTRESFSLEGLNIRYDLGWATLVSQTSYYDYRSDNDSDLTPTFVGTLAYYNSLAAGYAALYGLPAPPSPVPFIPFRQNYDTYERTIIEDTRVVSHINGPFHYVVGVFYQNADRPFHSNIIVPGFNTTYGPYLGLLAPDFTFPSSPAGDVYSITSSTRKERQIAEYGELTYAITPALHLTGGIRAFNFRNKSTDSFTGFAFQGVPALAPGSATASGVNPKFTADYHVTAQDMLYATASRGFRPGGSNIPLPATCDTSLQAVGITPPGPSQYNPDHVWNYEVGAKTSWANRRLTADFAAYQMNWSNVQLPVPLASCKIQGYVVNAGDARSRGGEIEVAAVPVRNLTLNLSAAYVNSQLTTNSTVLGAKPGTPLLYVPKWSWTVSGQYAFHLDGLPSYMRADVKHQGKTPLDYVGHLWSDSYTQLNVRWGMRLGPASAMPWELAVYAVNVTNARPLLSKDPIGYGPGILATSLQPRTIGVSVGVDF